MDQPLLTIAIPTYNRAAELQLCLQYLAPQIADRSDVELLIFDNASPDNTPDVVEAFLRTGMRGRYTRRPENIGPDANFLDCYEKANGKFVCIFGDDDVLFPGALDRILHVLKIPEVDLVHMPAQGFVTTPEERFAPDVDAPATLFQNSADFVAAVGYTGDLALISGVIVNKERVEAFPHADFLEGANSYLIQLGWTFSSLRHLRRAVLFKRGLLACCEKAPSRPFDMVKVFGRNWKEQAERFLDVGSPIYDAVLQVQLESWFANNWVMARQLGLTSSTPDPVGQMRRHYGDRLLFWLAVYPLLAWPMPFAKNWRRGIDVVRKIRRLWISKKATTSTI